MNSVHKWPSLLGRPSRAVLSEAGIPAAPRESSGGWAIVILVLANLWWTTLCLGGYRPETMVVTSALNLATLALWFAIEACRRTPPALHGAALATLPFLAYGAAQALWITPVPWLGWRDWLGWLQMAAVFWVVLHGVRTGRARTVLFAGLVALGVAAVGLAAYQQLRDPAWLPMGRRQSPQFFGRSGGPFGIPNSLAAFLNLLLPAVVALAFRRGAGVLQRVICGYLALLFALGVFFTLSRGAWLSLAVALTAWPLLALHGDVRRWRWSLIVALLLAGTAAATYLGDSGARARIDQLLCNRGEISRAVMWRAGWKLVQDQPLLGTGAGSYGVLFERHRPERFGDDPRWAHNDYLNTLSDYGAVGFLLSFGMAAVFVVAAGRRPFQVGAGADELSSSLRAGLTVGLLAFALQLLVDFNLKIPALAQAAAIAAALALAPSAAVERSRIERDVRVPWIAAAVAAVLLAVAIPWRVLPVYRAEALRYGAREQLEHLVRHPPQEGEAAPAIAQAREQLARAVRIDPNNGQAWSDLAESCLDEGRFEPGKAATLGREAEAASTQAIARSSVVPEFWERRARALDLQGRWRDAWADFIQVLSLAPNRSDLWYSYAWHLSRWDADSARSALASSLKLDPWNSAALALQKRLENSPR